MTTMVPDLSELKTRLTTIVKQIKEIIHDRMERERTEHRGDMAPGEEGTRGPHIDAEVTEEIEVVNEEADGQAPGFGAGTAELGAARQVDHDFQFLPPEDVVPDLNQPPHHELPKFIGNCSEWPSFGEQFNSAVDSIEELSEVNKLVCPRESFHLMKTLPVDYETAVISLRVIRQRNDESHAPVTQKDSTASLKKVLKIFQEKAQGLHDADLDEGWFSLGQVLLWKLDIVTRLAWESFQSDRRKWRATREREEDGRGDFSRMKCPSKRN